MNPDMKAKWIEALRSGKYQQGRNRLITESGRYCCIGVGAKVLFPEFEFNPDTATVCAAEKLGLTGGQQQGLVEMNDFQDKSFAEIADYIEKNL